MTSLKDFVAFFHRGHAQRIKVASDCPRKQRDILTDDGLRVVKLSNQTSAQGSQLTIRFLSSSRPMVEMSMPSILVHVSQGKISIDRTHRTLPPAASIIRRSDMAKVDLP